MAKTAIVIGAGITGVAAAEWLRRDGVRVTLVDRIDPGSDGQASYGNAGLLARSAVLPLSEPGMMWTALKMLADRSSPLFLKWRYLPRLAPWMLPFLMNGQTRRMMPIVDALTSIVTDAVDQHEALATGTEAAHFLRRGPYAYIFRDRAEYERHALDWAMRRRAGFDVAEIGRDDLARHDPHLSDRYGFAARLEDHGWLSDPGGYVAALVRHFTDQGGTFVKAEVSDIANGRVSLADGSDLKADKIVLAAGVWSGALAKRLKQKAMIESERGYHLLLKEPSFMPAHPFMVAEASFVVTPMDQGLRCAGIVEFGGLKAPMSQAPVTLLKKRIAQVYPKLTWSSETTWMGHRPSTPDSLPHIGALAENPDIVFAFGAQHIGLTLGPRMGRMAADIIAGRRPNIDLAPFRPERFH